MSADNVSHGQFAEGETGRRIDRRLDRCQTVTCFPLDAASIIRHLKGLVLKSTKLIESPKYNNASDTLQAH